MAASDSLNPRLFGSSDIAAMKPEEFKSTLDASARIQRGAPETHMVKMQSKYGGGVYPHALEHIGDLTHRIAEHGGAFGTEFVTPKVERMLVTLTRPYGFEREMREQMHENRSYRESKGESYPSEDEFMEDSSEYARLHSTVPVYTRPSHHAREAAVALGRHQFGAAIEHLTSLRSIIDRGPDYWKEQMSQQGAVDFLREQGR